MAEPEVEYYDRVDPERDPQQEDAMRAERVQALGAGLEKEAEGRVALRLPIENRWIEDIRQDAGKHPVKVEADLVAAGTSRVFANLTRPKRHVAQSRLSDMLFPTDDKNFGVRRTPVPQMDGGDKKAQAETPEGVKMVADEDGNELTVQQTVEQMADEAAKLMETEIEDQLTEAKYASVCREAIRDACLIGTGVVKGPIIVGRMRRMWRDVQGMKDGKKHVEYKLEFEKEHIAAVEWVDPFHFFPDMSASKIEDSVSEFQRHYMTKRQMVELSRRPDFFQDKVREVLSVEPNMQPPNYLVQLRELADQLAEATEKRYLVWEYHGPISAQMAMDCGCENVDDEDPLEILEAVIWISGGTVLKATINPMDSQERPWGVFNWEKNHASIFGYGVPYQTRDAQAALNASYRMLMDNASLSTGPQIVVNDKIVEPVKEADGTKDWRLKRRKVWRVKDRNKSVKDAFATFDIPGHMAELREIMTMAIQLFDLETNLTATTQSDQAPMQQAVHATARGMEMLMNSDNVIMRDAVKNWDDDMTEPLIGRFYNYNMQFNPKQEIKGDFQVDARGSSALLLKETQARNIFNIANFAGTDALAPLTKWAPLYRLMVSTGQIEADDIVKTDEEIRKDQEAAAEQGQTDPEVEKNKMLYAIHREKLEDNQIARQHTAQLAQMKMDTALVMAADKREGEDAKNQAKRLELLMKIQGDRQKIADEAMIKAQYGSGI